MNLRPCKLLAAIAALAVLAPAHAQMGRRGMPEPRGGFERNAMPPPAEPARQFPQHQDFMPPGRLSPEERRQLRRDIHEAGRELYRGNAAQRPPR